MSLAHDIAADYPDFEQALLGAQSKLDASHILRRGEGEASIYSSTSRGYVRYDLFRRGDMWHWERKGPLSPSLPEGVEMIPDVLDLGWDPEVPMRVVAEEAGGPPKVGDVYRHRRNEYQLVRVTSVTPSEDPNDASPFYIEAEGVAGGDPISTNINSFRNNYARVKDQSRYAAHAAEEARGSDRERWEKLQGEFRRLTDEMTKVESEAHVKWGPHGLRYASRALQTKRAKLVAARNRVYEKIFAMTQKLSPRDWGTGVPTWWVAGKLSFDDLTRPIGEPLSVTPPLAYGATRPMQEANEARFVSVPITRIVAQRAHRGRDLWTAKVYDEKGHLRSGVTVPGSREYIEKKMAEWFPGIPIEWEEGAREMGAVRENVVREHSDIGRTGQQWATDMREFLGREFPDGDEFSREAAIYWYASDYYAGQGDPLYAVLSQSEFRPSPRHRSVTDEGEEAVMMYDAIVTEFGGSEVSEASEAAIPTKAQLKIIDAFRARSLRGNPMRDSISTDGDTIYSYRMPIARRTSNGGVSIVDPAGAPSATTRNHIYGLQRTFTPAEISGGSGSHQHMLVRHGSSRCECGAIWDPDKGWIEPRSRAAEARRGERVTTPHGDRFEVVEYTLPVYWASYLINGDASGLEDGEQEQIDAWLEREGNPHFVDVSDDSHFAGRNDATNLGGDVAKYTAHVRGSGAEIAVPGQAAEEAPSGERAFYVTSQGDEIPVEILSRGEPGWDGSQVVRMRYTGRSRARWKQGEIFNGSSRHLIARENQAAEQAAEHDDDRGPDTERAPAPEAAPRMQPGYAFYTPSKRKGDWKKIPNDDWEHVVVGEDEIEKADLVGYRLIDGSMHDIFEINFGGHTRVTRGYFAQLQTHTRGRSGAHEFPGGPFTAMDFTSPKEAIEHAQRSWGATHVDFHGTRNQPTVYGTKDGARWKKTLFKEKGKFHWPDKFSKGPKRLGGAIELTPVAAPTAPTKQWTHPGLPGHPGHPGAPPDDDHERHLPGQADEGPMLRPVTRRRRGPQALPRRIDQTELHKWSERDRAHVELRDKITGETIIEWWDDAVQDAIQDGFLDPRNLHASAFEYAVYVGLIKPQESWGPREAGEARRAPTHLSSVQARVQDLWKRGRSLAQIEDELNVTIVVPGGIADQSPNILRGNFRVDPGINEARRRTARENPATDLQDAIPWVRVTRDPERYKEAIARAAKIGPIDDARKVYDLVGPALIKEDQETFIVVLIDVRQNCRGVAEIHRGQRSRVATSVLDVMRVVVASGAEGFIVVHNHPSGKAMPSSADRDLTKAIERAAKPFAGETAFLDHVVCGAGEYFSFADNKLHRVKN